MSRALPRILPSFLSKALVHVQRFSRADGLWIVTVSLLTGCMTSPALQTPDRPASASLTLRIQAPVAKGETDFRLKVIEPTDIGYAQASLSGPGIATPLAPSSPSNPFALPAGASTQAVVFQLVPQGKNRIVTVQALDNNQQALPAHYEIKGVADIQAGSNQATISWQTTPTARVIEKLISDASPMAATVDSAALQTVIDRLIDNNTAGNTADDLHPSLINKDALAAYITANSGLPPALPVNRASFALTPGTVVVNLTGAQEAYLLNSAAMTVFPPVTLTSNDPASPVTVLPASNQAGSATTRSYTLNNLTPGSGYTLKIQPAYHTGSTATFSVSAGGTTTVNLTYGAGQKRHYFSEAIAGMGNEVRRFQNNDTLDILLIKPSNPAATALNWTAGTHLAAAQKAIAQLQHLFKMVQSGTVTEVFDNDADFAVRALPALGSTFDPNFLNAASPNYVGNQGPAPAGHLVGRHDLYLRWRTNFCGENNVALGVCRNTYHSNFNSYVTIVELGTQNCSGQSPDADTLTSVALHEMLHALGAAGHSSNPADLMSASVSLTSPSNVSATIRDINTLKFLYDATPSRVNLTHTP